MSKALKIGLVYGIGAFATHYLVTLISKEEE